MGLLSKKKKPLEIHALPAGCITIDRNGTIVATTIPQTVPAAKLQHIAQVVSQALHGARAINMSLTEMQVDYPALKIVVRELKGGAILFLTPRNFVKA